MSFMEPEVFEGSMWVVEDNHGETVLFPGDYFSKKQVKKEVPGARSIKEVGGWWGRYQAPGYMDSTDWSGPYDTEQEAYDDLQEMYGDDEEEEDGDNL